MKKKYLIFAAIIIFVVLMIFSVSESAFLFLRLDPVPNNFLSYYLKGLKTSIYLILAIWLVLVLFAYILSERLIRVIGELADSPMGLQKMSSYSDLLPIAKKIRRLSGLSLDGFPDSATGTGFALENLNQGVILLSKEQAIIFCNQTAADLLEGKQLGFEEVLKKRQDITLRTILDKKDYQFSFLFAENGDTAIIITDITAKEEFFRLKNSLIDALSLKIVAPLSRISSYAGLIRGGLTERNAKEAAEVIEKESKEIATFIKELKSTSVDSD